jgi:hypothetical protein
MDDQGLSGALELPGNGFPKTRELARTLASGAPGVTDRINRILGLFRTGGFVYSLTPPRTGPDPVDGFLFGTRSGFCEHYASATATLLRAMGVPARIVGGYLGGEINPFGDYLVVRHSLAHVWVEAWDRDLGWLRVDPTAVVEPLRLSRSLDDARKALAGRGSLTALFLDLKLRWEALNTWWTDRFSAYSQVEQAALLQRLGITGSARSLAVKALGILAGLGGMLVILYVAFLLKAPRSRPDEVGDLYREFCRKLARAGLSRRPDTAPGDWAVSVAEARPDLAPEVGEITRLYVLLRYARDPGPKALTAFRTRVRAFRPARHGPPA